MICLACLYIYLNLNQSHHDFFNYPLTHCYPNGSVLSSRQIEVDKIVINICDQQSQCPQLVRICARGELPIDLLFYKVSVSPTLFLDQGSQSRGPRAACGPPDAFVRHANLSKLYEL
jgi:hypothetical protein